MFLIERIFTRSAIRITRLAVPVSLGVILLTGCAKKVDETYLTVQMCVHDQEGVKQFKSVMRVVAAAENLEFIDGSSEAGKNLKAMGADRALKRDAALAINVGIKGDGGTFVMGGNLGLPPYQVALGFGTGSEPTKARELSKHLVHLLTEKWNVEIVPQGKGVFAMKDCDSSQTANVLTATPSPLPSPLRHR